MTQARRRAAGLAGGLLLLLGLSACGGEDVPPEPTPTQDVDETPTQGAGEPSAAPADPSPGPTTGAAGEEQDSGGEVAAAAVQHLAGRLGIPADEVTVLRDEAVTWPDGSLGCPDPGMSYTQALVDGRLVQLEAEGSTYEYHAGEDGEPFLCQDPRPPVGSTTE